MSPVDRYRDSHVSFITLLDSEGGNLLNGDMLNALKKALQESFDDEESRVVVLQSNGAAFCLGMDLLALEEDSKSRGEGIETALDTYISVLEGIHNSAQPVVSVLRGPVRAGGVGITAASDIVIASDDASVELTEAIIGLIPANVLPYLVGKRLTPQQARYLVISAKKLDAREAKRFGLVEEVYEVEGLNKGLKTLLKQLLRISPLSVVETKKTINSMETLDHGESQQFAREKLLSMLASEERMEHIRAFNQGIIPPWFKRFTPEHSIEPGEAHE